MTGVALIPRRAFPIPHADDPRHDAKDPDLCGEREFHDDRRDLLFNPALIVEVLSDSTEVYDKVELDAIK